MPPKSAQRRKEEPPIEDLIGMHDSLVGRIDDEIQTLEGRLAQLRAYKARLAGAATPAPNQKGGKVPPKYRNPANPTETWAGRGVHPKWLARELKSGKKLSDFEIKS